VSWSIKKADHQRTDAFEFCWRRLLRVPRTARSNQSILKKIRNRLTHIESYNKLKVTKEEAAAAAAKSLQSCPTLCDPMDGSPPGSPIPRILQARTLERVAISFSNA